MPGDGKDVYMSNSYITSGKVKWLKKTVKQFGNFFKS